jgi:hypothetical protein
MDPKVYFTVEAIEKDQEDNIRLLNLAAIDFCRAIRDLIPPSADQRDCIRKLREIVYVGEAAIKLRGDP